MIWMIYVAWLVVKLGKVANYWKPDSKWKHNNVKIIFQQCQSSSAYSWANEKEKLKNYNSPKLSLSPLNFEYVGIILVL